MYEKLAIKTLASNKLTATGTNNDIMAGGSGLANAAKLLKKFVKTDDSTLSDGYYEQRYIRDQVMILISPIFGILTASCVYQALKTSDR